MDTLPTRLGQDGLPILTWMIAEAGEDPIIRCWAVQHVGTGWAVYRSHADADKAASTLVALVEEDLARQRPATHPQMPFPPGVLMPREALLALSQMPERRDVTAALVNRILQNGVRDYLDLAAQIAGEQQMHSCIRAIRDLQDDPSRIVAGAAREAVSRLDGK